MTTVTQSKTDLMYEILYNPDFVPLPSPRVNVKTTTVDGKSSYLMKNHITGIYYEPDETTNLIWNLTDGKKNVKEIVEEAQRKEKGITEDMTVGTLLFFAEASLLISTTEPTKKKRLKVVSAFEIDYTLIDSSKEFLSSIHRKLRPLLNRTLLVASFVSIIIAAVLFAGQFVSIFGNKSNFEILGSTVVGFFFYYFVALAPVIAIHEIAHGLALVHYGGQPGEMGTGLFYFGPMFYTETTDAWGLRKKHRMMVYLAGNISTLLVGSAVTFIILLFHFPRPTALILTMIAFYCFNTSLFNFAPPFETDGYYILSDAVNMPNLRRDSYSFVGSNIRRIFGARADPKFHGLSSRKKGILAGYAVLSVGWILYIVFQTSLFMTYMSQDVTIALSSLLQSLWKSQPVPIAVVVVTAASVLYFGMQIVGYGSLFSAAIKKAAAKPIRVEAIHDRDVAVFAYLPPEAPSELTSELRNVMQKTARKFTTAVEMREAGGSIAAVLRIGGANLAFVQMKESLKRVEEKFSSVYQNFLLTHSDLLQKSIGVNSPDKHKITTMFRRLGREAATTGDSGASAIVDSTIDKQKEISLYLLTSAFGAVWTIEVQPAHEYEIQRDIMPNLLVEDVTLTDLYGDCENFKKNIVYGCDSLAKLASETSTALSESLAHPQQYQSAGVFEPVRGRITFVGRTEQIEKRIHIFAPFFVSQTWCGYMENLLKETCYALSTVNQAPLPPNPQLKEMSDGELTILAADLTAFAENQEITQKCVGGSQAQLARTKEKLQKIRNETDTSGNGIALTNAMFNVNTENLEALPARIKTFMKEWKTTEKKVEKVRKSVEAEQAKRIKEVRKKKRRMLKFSVPVHILTAVFAVLGFLPSLHTWSIELLATGLAVQLLYWGTFRRAWRSFTKASTYPSQAFTRVHSFILAAVQAAYPYVVTSDILSLEKME